MTRLASGVTIYFVRHGQTEWNRLRRLQGQMDIPLNDTGRMQAERNGRVLKEIVPNLGDLPFVSSPLRRTSETMEIAREAAGMRRHGYAKDDRLREIHYGNWEGAYLTEVQKTDPEGYALRKADKYNWCPHGGESYADLTRRVAGWLGEIQQTTVVVSHGGVSRVLRGILFDLDRWEIPMLEVPQDKVMVLRRDELAWA